MLFYKTKQRLLLARTVGMVRYKAKGTKKYASGCYYVGNLTIRCG